MKFLLEILGMTNQCNLRCSYCDWKKDKYFPLEDKHKRAMKNHIKKIREYIEEHYLEVALVEYSGGEPFVYPEIIEELLNNFSDRWLRIITNGLLIKEDMLEKIKKHGKTFLAVSLDGHDIESNKPRFGDNEELFNRVIENIRKIVSYKIPLMLLCTINKQNIDKFPEYINFLEKEFSEEINSGMLVMPTHLVTNYSKDNGKPSLNQYIKFSDYIRNDGRNHPIINRIMLHYESLVNFIENGRREKHCNIYDWSLSVHFRQNEIVTDGNLLSFGCGMRGVNEFGLYNINSNEDIKELNAKIDEFDFDNDEFTNLNSEYNPINEDCEEKCFVDWVIFDLAFTGTIKYSELAEWFILFKDKNIKNFIEKYLIMNSESKI